MPFIPHTEEDVREMLRTLGIPAIESLFDEIPSALRGDDIASPQPGLPEMALLRLMSERAEADGRYLCFIGAGAYEHHIPAAVWQLASRGEFYTAYTPYQAEASQGSLQALYEFQSMMTALTGLDVSNASLYDGATALAEAVLMAVRAHGASHRVLLPRSVNPLYRAVVRTLTRNQQVDLIEADFSPATGSTPLEAVKRAAGAELAALVIPQPNFFGMYEDADTMTDWAHSRGAQVIALVNPLSLALLRPPGEWGSEESTGADIAVGDGQPLGAPLSGGGPHFGFLCARQALLRQMPGRIVGRTVDDQGRTGYCLTLQAREQHIRRAKATSNICTNQGLMAVAAAVHLSLLGPRGLELTATACHTNAVALRDRLTALPGVRPVFSGPFFHEIVLSLPASPQEVLERLSRNRILGGLDLRPYYPELGNAVLLCATETKTADDIGRLAAALEQALGEVQKC